MTDQHPRDLGDTPASDGDHRPSQHLRTLIKHPLALGILVVAGGAALFRMGVAVGESAFWAFEGDTTAAVTFGVALVIFVVLVVALGVRLDSRRRRRTRQRSAARDNDHSTDAPSEGDPLP